MNALRGPIPESRANPENKQPAPKGNTCFRAVREIAATVYMPRGENGERRLDATSVELTAYVVTVGCALVVSMCEFILLNINYRNDSDSVSAAEVWCSICKTGILLCAFSINYALLGKVAIRRLEQEGQRRLEAQRLRNL